MIWLAVTADQYELPIAVRDTAYELAKALGVSRGMVYKRLREGRNEDQTGYAIVTIEEGQNMIEYSNKYDEAIDKQDFYSDIHDKLSGVLLTIQNLGDTAFDTDHIENMMDYAGERLREYRALVDELEKEERRQEKYNIAFADI